MSADKAKAVSGGGPAPSTESLEQVRDILFGAQMRSVESRLSQIEERMRRELEQLRATFESKLADVERRLQQELGVERDERGAAFESMRVTQGEAMLGLSGALDTLRGELQQESQRWEVSLQRTGAELRSELGTVAADLETRKPDAARLAELFRQMVGRLEQPAPTDDE